MNIIATRSLTFKLISNFTNTINCSEISAYILRKHTHTMHTKKHSHELANTSIWKFIKPNVFEPKPSLIIETISMIVSFAKLRYLFHELWIKCSRLIRKAVSPSKGIQANSFPAVLAGSRLFRWSSFDCVDLYKYPDQITV